MALLLHLCLCLVTVIRVTSSQTACDVTKQENDDIQIVVKNCGRNEQLMNNGSICCQRNEQVLGQLATDVSRMETTINGSSCGRSEQRLSQLATAVSQMQTTNSQLVTALSRMEMKISQLQNDVAELKTAAGCPANFTRISSVNRGCYKVVTRNLNWTDAGLECRRLHRNAHLLIINDAQEQFAVARMLPSAGASLTGCYRDPSGTYFYTAGQRSGSSLQSTFVWRVTSGNAGNDTVSTMTYTNWRSGQPSFDERSCMSITSGYSYIWSDVQCNLATCSVCELDI